MLYVDETGEDIHSIVDESLKGLVHYPVTGLGFVTKEWAKLFLKNWNRAVELWDSGHMFRIWKRKIIV